MESGQQKPVVITWVPPADHDPNVAMETNIKLMVRGDVSETYNIMLRALITTTERLASQEMAAAKKVAAEANGQKQAQNAAAARASPGKDIASVSDKVSLKLNSSDIDLNQTGEVGSPRASIAGDARTPKISVGASPLVTSALLEEDSADAASSGVKVDITPPE